jgi:hypothetical protein
MSYVIPLDSTIALYYCNPEIALLHCVNTLFLYDFLKKRSLNLVKGFFYLALIYPVDSKKYITIVITGLLLVFSWSVGLIIIQRASNIFLIKSIFCVPIFTWFSLQGKDSKELIRMITKSKANNYSFQEAFYFVHKSNVLILVLFYLMLRIRGLATIYTLFGTPIRQVLF